MSMFYPSSGGTAAVGGGSLNVNGSTVASPNIQSSDTAYHQLTSAGWTVSGSNISGRQYLYPPTCAIWGDSISTMGTQSGGTVLPAGTGGYAGLLAINECSNIWINAAASGDMSADLNLKVYAQTASSYLFPSAFANNRAAISTVMIGTNEANSKQTSGYQTGVFRPSQYGILTYLALPRANKVFAQTAGAVKTGTWTNDDQFFAGMGTKSNTNGDTVSVAGIVTTAAEPFIYFGYGAVDANAGAFSVKVDGVTCTDTVTGSATLNNVGGVAISTTNGATKAVFGGRCAAAAGTHTVLFTVTSATNASNVVYIEWVGSMPTVAAGVSSLPRILESGVLKQRSDTNATWTTNYDTEVSSIVSTLSGDLLPVQFVTVNDLTTAVGFYTDGIHPADNLHALIHDRFSQYMQGFGGHKFTTLAIGGGTATNKWLDPVICITNNQGEFAFGTCPVDNNSLGDFTKNLNAHNLNAENAFQLYTSGKANNIGVWAGTELDVASNVAIGWSNSTTSIGTIQTRLTGATAGVVSVDTTAAANGLGTIKPGKYATTANCSSSAAPAVCAAAAAGSVVVAAAATTVVVNTTAVTANSQIFLEFDSSLGSKLSVTCNTTEPALYGVTARSAGTSFTITSSSPVTNPACFSYFIVN